MDKVTRPCPQTTIFEEKGELKRIRTEVLLLTIKPYRKARSAHVMEVGEEGDYIPIATLSPPE